MKNELPCECQTESTSLKLKYTAFDTKEIMYQQKGHWIILLEHVPINVLFPIHAFMIPVAQTRH